MESDFLKNARLYCEAKGSRFTEPRRAVLKIMIASHKPLSAYEILEKLGELIKNPKPPTVYRAIEFWQKHKFIHRIESLGAYVVCEAGHQHNGSQFMICDDCGTVIETHLCQLPQTLEQTIAQNNFKLSSWNLEIHGLCIKCA